MSLRKKIAILSPVAWRTPPRQYGAWETVASNIAEGLASRDWDVTLFATADSITRGHLHAVIDRGYEEDRTIDPKVAEYLTSPKCLSMPRNSTSSTVITTSWPYVLHGW